MKIIQIRRVLLLVLPGLFSKVVGAGLTTCSSTNTDWYTNVVGETPCTTYQRLRQTCNADYEVGTLTSNTPPDHCDDQVGSCCCNSISFALSMLCLACQDKAANGFDAGVGAYQMYLTRSSGTGTCGTGTNQSLPADIQSAVCNQKIKIEDALYGLFWGDGSWFYVYTRDTITKDNLAKNNNTFTHCESTWNNLTTTAAVATPTVTTDVVAGTGGVSTDNLKTTSGAGPGTTQQSDQTGTTAKSALSPGAIAGIAVGVIALVGLIIIAVFLFYRHRQKSEAYGKHQPPGSVQPYMTTVAAPVHASHASPATRPLQPLRWGVPPPPTTINTTSEEFSETSWGTSSHGRHTDAGPVRRPSGRLPPAYGSFNDVTSPQTEVFSTSGSEGAAHGHRRGGTTSPSTSGSSERRGYIGKARRP